MEELEINYLLYVMDRKQSGRKRCTTTNAYLQLCKGCCDKGCCDNTNDTPCSAIL